MQQLAGCGLLVDRPTLNHASLVVVVVVEVLRHEHHHELAVTLCCWILSDLEAWNKLRASVCISATAKQKVC